MSSGRHYLLIHPPVVRNCEPPGGLARLAGMLTSAGIPNEILDLNAEGFDWLIGAEQQPANAGTRSALKRRDRITAELRSPEGYEKITRYTRGVSDLGLILKGASRPCGVTITPTDYQDDRLSPLSKEDLLTAATEEEHSPYHPLYSRRIDGIGKVSGFTHVCLSIGFLSQALPAFAMAGYLNKHHPEVIVYMGGSLITTWYRLGLIPETETFDGLVGRILPGRAEDHVELLTGLKEISAPPDYSRFPLDSYIAPGLILPFSLSWGCPWKRCTFCPERSENTPYGSLPPSAAITQLRDLADRYHPRLLHITDSEIVPGMLKRITERPPGVPWYGFARFTKELEDHRFCRELAASGCMMLQLGMESGSQSVLDAMDKGTDAARNLRIIEQLHRAGIGVFLYILFGTPEEDADSARETLTAVENISGALTGLNTAIFNMPRFSPAAGSLATGQFYNGDLSLYCSFRHPKGWNRGTVRKFIRSEYETSPGIRSVLERTPPVYTSSHAPFFISSGIT